MGSTTESKQGTNDCICIADRWDSRYNAYGEATQRKGDIAVMFQFHHPLELAVAEVLRNGNNTPGIQTFSPVVTLLLSPIIRSTRSSTLALSPYRSSSRRQQITPAGVVQANSRSGGLVQGILLLQYGLPSQPCTESIHDILAVTLASSLELTIECSSKLKGQ
jgi:hypothetical protein